MSDGAMPAENTLRLTRGARREGNISGVVGRHRPTEWFNFRIFSEKPGDGLFALQEAYATAEMRIIREALQLIRQLARRHHLDPSFRLRDTKILEQSRSWIGRIDQCKRRASFENAEQ